MNNLIALLITFALALAWLRHRLAPKAFDGQGVRLAQRVPAV